jgi:hypothetical protein
VLHQVCMCQLQHQVQMLKTQVHPLKVHWNA